MTKSKTTLTMLAVGSRPWQKLCAYWGLAILVNDNILFDTFANYRTLSKKLKKAGIKPAQIKHIIISHDHWDHTGGLWGLLKEDNNKTIYLPSGASQATKKKIRETGATLIDEKGQKTLAENIIITEEQIGQFNGKTIPEQSLAIKGEKGLTLIVGCAHPSILEITKAAKENLDQPIHHLIGGLHLFKSTKQEATACATDLKEENITKITPTHCTGWRNERIFKKIFKNGFTPFKEGQKIEID